MPAIEDAEALPAQVAGLQQAANAAVQSRVDICAAEAAAQAALGQMAATETAQAYMKLAVLAANADDAAQALDVADARAAAARAAIVQANAALGQVNAATAQAGVSRVAAAGLFGPLDQNGNPGVLADLANARALLQHGKDVTNHADAAVVAARTIAHPDQPPCIGTQAVDAATTASEKLTKAAGAAPRIGNAAQILPALPAVCTNPAQYALNLAALQLAGNAAAVAADCAPVTAAAAPLTAAAGPAGPVVTQKKADIRALTDRAATIKARVIYNAADVRHDRNPFGTDVTNINQLATDANAMAASAQNHTQQAVNALLPIDVPAAGVPAATAALRARLMNIRQLAHDTAAFIPYNPAANSAATITALDQAAVAAQGMQALDQQARRAANALQRADRVVAAVQVEQARLAGIDRTAATAQLTEAWETARRIAGAARAAVQSARANLAELDPLIQNCPLAGRKGRRLVEALNEVQRLRGVAANPPPSEPQPPEPPPRCRRRWQRGWRWLPRWRGSSRRAWPRRCAPPRRIPLRPPRLIGGSNTSRLRVMARSATKVTRPWTRWGSARSIASIRRPKRSSMPRAARCMAPPPRRRSSGPRRSMSGRKRSHARRLSRVRTRLVCHCPPLARMSRWASPAPRDLPHGRRPLVRRSGFRPCRPMLTMAPARRQPGHRWTCRRCRWRSPAARNRRCSRPTPKSSPCCEPIRTVRSICGPCGRRTRRRRRLNVQDAPAMAPRPIPQPLYDVLRNVLMANLFATWPEDLSRWERGHPAEAVVLRRQLAAGALTDMVDPAQFQGLSGHWAPDSASTKAWFHELYQAHYGRAPHPDDIGTL